MKTKLALDPPVSEKQRRAMEAAAHGKSTLGIPKSVGREFVGDVFQVLYDALKAEADAEDEERLASDMAMDRREYSVDGHLHVAENKISMANICPYYGREIPDPEHKLGLDPDKVYQLLRDPEELAKAASTFDNKPLLYVHKGVSAGEHPKELVVGSTGTDARFEAPYLFNSLVVWDQEAIDLVESGEQEALSCGYHYDPDMTPGEYQGKKYDGVMRNIVGNHVALVSTGRVSGALVGDSAEGTIMNKQAFAGAYRMGGILGFLQPRMAVDAKPNFKPLVKLIGDFSKNKPAIVAEVRKATKGKLAKDASIAGFAKLLESLEDAPTMDALEDMPKEKAKDKKSAKDAAKEFLKGKLSEDDMKACDALWDDDEADDADPDDDDDDKKKDDDDDKKKDDAEDGDDDADDADPDDDKEDNKDAKDMKAKDKGAKDEPPPFKGKPEVGKGPKAVDKAAMDAALKSQAKTIRQTERDIRAAERFVQPYVGTLAADSEFDSAADVYKTALEMRDVAVDGVHPSAYRKLLEMLPVSPHKEQRKPAMDSAATDSFAKQFPDAAPMRAIG